jgi:hypothetical protein
MRDREYFYSVILVGLVLLFVPLGVPIELWHVGLGVLLSLFVGFVLFYTRASRFNVGLVVLLFALPFWWFITGSLDAFTMTISISLYLTTAYFLVVNYDQVEIKQENVKIEPMPEIYFGTLAAGLVLIWLMPLETDLVSTAVLGLSLAIAFAWLIKNIGVGLATPTLLILAVLPLVPIIYWPELVWQSFINSALVIAIWSSLFAYVLLRR